jgi:hypothetical protein
MKPENSDFDDNEISKIELCLATFILKLKGFSSRAISDMDLNLPAHTTIIQRINTGEEYFKRLFPLMKKIKELLTEKAVQEGRFNLKMNDFEMKQALKMFNNTPEAQREFPELYKSLKRGVVS